jgi:PadR family transcriptional regulator, regulatory protein PadR
MIDLEQCPCSGINLDKLIQPMILLFLSDRALHGYGLVQEIMNSPMFRGDKPDPTGVYRFLKTMENRGLVVSQWELVESGPAKKTYRITEEGLICLEQWVATLRDYVSSIETLLATADRMFPGSGRQNASDKGKGEMDPPRDTAGCRS